MNNEEDHDGDIGEELAAELDLALADDDVIEEDEQEESNEDDNEVEDDEDAQEGKLLRRELQSRKRESIFYRSTLGEINSISYIYIIPHLKTSRNASRMLLLQTRK